MLSQREVYIHHISTVINAIKKFEQNPWKSSNQNNIPFISSIEI